MTAPQATGPRQPFEALFAQLTGRMRVVHELGPVANGVAGQPGRVVWNLGAVDSAKRKYRKQGADFCGFLSLAFQVELYGGSPLELVTLRADLEAWLDLLVGPEQGASDAGDGYQIGKSTPIETGDGTSTGSGCKVPVTLFVPVYQQIWGRRTVGTVSVNVLALKSTDDAPTGDALNPIEVAAA